VSVEDMQREAQAREDQLAAITVSELVELLLRLPADMVVLCSYDGGYGRMRLYGLDRMTEDKVVLRGD